MKLWNSVAISHTGKVRQINEDAFINRENVGFWAVADGMGGHAAGDYASQQIVLALSQFDFSVPEMSEIVDGLDDALTKLDVQLKDYADTQQVSAVGSTLAALYLTENNLGLVYWVGDSRVYLHRDEELIQLSRDHSLVQELIDVGELTEAQAEFFPSKNIITRAIGANNNVCSEISLTDFSSKDVFLVCSDGLINEISDSQINDILNNEEWTLKEKAQKLLDETLEGKAADNITLILVEIQ